MNLLTVFLPEFFLSLISLVLLAINILFLKNEIQRYYSWLIAIILSLLSFIFTPFTEKITTIDFNFIENQGFYIIRFFLFFSALLIYLSLYKVIISTKYLVELSFFMFVSVSFLSFLSVTINLFIAFVLIELVSFSFYILVSIYRNNLYSVEAGLKYFYLGTFSSLIFLTGIFMVYLATLKFSLISISEELSSQINIFILSLGLLLISIALIFKLGGSPLQFWLPEVYQGSPLIVFPLLIALSKLSIGLLLGNIFFYIIPQISQYLNYQWFKNTFFIVSLLSMLIGNFFAIRQRELKRLLAYSSIAHVGYFLSLFSLEPVQSNIRLLGGYLFIYALTNLSFLVAFQLANSSQFVKISLSEYERYLPKCPILLFSMLIFILSLAGIPPTAGFITKFFILLELIKNGSNFLSFIFLLTSILSIYYYFKLINPILKILRTKSEFSDTRRSSDLHEVFVKIILLVISLYLVFSIFKPNYIFFM